MIHIFQYSPKCPSKFSKYTVTGLRTGKATRGALVSQSSIELEDDMSSFGLLSKLQIEQIITRMVSGKCHVSQGRDLRRLQYPPGCQSCVPSVRLETAGSYSNLPVHNGKERASGQ